MFPRKESLVVPSMPVALRQRRAVAAGALLVAAIVVLPALGGDWPQFRGPAGDGTVAASGLFEGDAAIVLEPTWKVPIGSGYSGLAIAGGKVVTMFSDGRADVMAAFDVRDGNELWRFEIEPTYAGHDGSHDGPLATPLIVGNSAIGLGARGRFFAVALDSGAPTWSRDLVQEFDSVTPHYGFSTSPILLEGVVILQLGKKGGAVAGFAPATGELLWATGEGAVTCQSPTPWTVAGSTQLVAAGAKNVFGLDPRTGDLLWQFRHDGGGGRGSSSMTPVPCGDERILLAHKDDASMIVEIEHDANGTTAVAGWEGRAIRNSYNVPVYHDGWIYAFSSRFLTAVDPATGEPAWRSRPPGDGFLMVVDGQLVVLTKEGSLHVAPASPDGYDERAAIALFDDVVWSHPAFADGAVFARSLGELARVDVRRGEVPSRIAGRDRNAIAGTRFAEFLETARRAPEPQAAVNAMLREAGNTPLTEDNWVHFVYRGDGDDVAVAGDMFGARQERPMERLVGSDLFHYSMQLEPDLRANYLFIDDYEQRTDPLNDRRTTTSVMGRDMEMTSRGKMEMSWFAMPEWTAPDFLAKAPRDQRGVLEPHDWDSTAFGRKVRTSIYLPAEYSGGDARYPVAFVHDGGAARKRGGWPNSLDNLIGARVAPMIVVFVQTTPGRNNDGYAAMITEELLPWIDTTYRTLAGPETRAHIGAGRGAYTAFYCTFSQPGVVANVGAQSLFMFDSNRVNLEPLIGTADEQPLNVYLEWGRYDLRNPHEAWDIGVFSERFADYLTSRGYAPTGGEVHAGTGWSSWRNRTDVVLEALFPGVSQP